MNTPDCQVDDGGGGGGGGGETTAPLLLPPHAAMFSNDPIITTRPMVFFGDAPSRPQRWRKSIIRKLLKSGHLKLE